MQSANFALIDRKMRPGRTATLLALGWLILFTPQAEADEGKVYGKAQYEKIPYFYDAKTGTGGLQLDKPNITPIIGARIDLVAGNDIVGTTFTTADGTYEIPWFSFVSWP
jgi:hypothetical protein